MPTHAPADVERTIVDIVRAHPDGVAAQEIAQHLPAEMPRRTLQYRLKQLVDRGRLAREGERRWARYRLATRSREEPAVPRGFAETGPDEGREGARGPDKVVPVSKAGAEIRAYLRQPEAARKPVAYDRRFLDAYRPNVSAYLPDAVRAQLRRIGTPPTGDQPAGTYARDVLNRLLIDLSWNSSRLEGNTYSLLDTRRLLAFGAAAEGHARVETQMILNHKDAIEFLVESADEIGFDRATLLNLHALLGNDLLEDPGAEGRLRRIPVGIGHSVFHPLAVPQQIEECFDQILATAGAIEDPFEQAFFAMVHLPYLQPFEDVNKRVSRLAANIPLIKANLAPLSFTEVPTATYVEAVLGVYELTRVELLCDVFVWAYERSAARYAVVRQTIGEPDPFRFKHREGRRRIVGEIVREALDRRAALERIAAFARQTVEPAEREAFRAEVETDLLSLHEGNFARFRLRPSEFHAWQAVWNAD